MRRLETKYLRENRDNLIMKTVSVYNLLRNRVNRELKKSKKQYYAEYFSANLNNIKKPGMA